MKKILYIGLLFISFFAYAGDQDELSHLLTYNSGKPCENGGATSPLRGVYFGYEVLDNLLTGKLYKSSNFRPRAREDVDYVDEYYYSLVRMEVEGRIVYFPNYKTKIK